MTKGEDRNHRWSRILHKDWRERLAWQTNEAICKQRREAHGPTPDYWFVEKDQEVLERHGVIMCFACPLRRPCLEHAMTWPERSGTWGGMTAVQRGQFNKRFQAGELSMDELMELSEVSARTRGIIGKGAQA